MPRTDGSGVPASAARGYDCRDFAAARAAIATAYRSGVNARAQELRTAVADGQCTQQAGFPATIGMLLVRPASALPAADRAAPDLAAADRAAAVRRARELVRR
jgi:hypothetical protein